MTDIDDIAAFVEIAAAGGLTQAARRLAVSKSVLSRRLARLEAVLGVSLFVRTSRGVRLTDQGATFQPHAERMLWELAAGTEAVQPDAEPSGTLRIAAPLAFGEAFLAPLIADLAVRHPRLEIRTFYSDAIVDLVGERFDLGIRLGALPDSTLLATRIGTAETGVVAAPAYVARHGVPNTPEEVARHQALVHAALPWRFVRDGGIVTLRPTGRFVADSAPALLAAARAGLGLAMVPAFLAADDVRSGTLVRVLADHPCPPATISVVRPSAIGAMPSKVRVLVDLLRARLGGGVGWN